MPTIKGGYVLTARIIQEKKISKSPPHFREIWNYLYREANHKDNKYGLYSIKRGQLFRSYDDIKEDLSWYVGWRKHTYSTDQIKKGMKFLRESLMIATAKAPAGVLITVLNYSHYQDPKNYESAKESTNESTIVALPYNKNDKNDKNVFSENSIELELSTLLLKNILINNPKFKTPNLQKWCPHIDRAIRIDKRTPDELRKVIIWCQQDDFWKANILSTSKLRKQFDKLWIKMPKQEISRTQKEITPDNIGELDAN